ncbi:MAG: glycosyltransferase [Romboutsia sp.]|uniref:glycosyltransferase n=1 Tax=Romboutsia sp. TaxID=1965302 RepID=UPI003F41229E
MFDNTLSVCMIVKNEEKNINRCLQSIKHIADEVIIVDTGSTDETVSIAKKFGAKVIDVEWTNDFSQARNISLENATKNWILVLDADEEISFEEGAKLKNILKLNSKLEAFHLRLVNMVSNVDIGDSIVLRLFKNNVKYRFEGKMHEQIVHSIERNSNGSLIGSTDIKIKHYGYDPNLADLEKKQQRNMDLLNSYPLEKRDGYFYYSLGNEYARVNDIDKALECYYKALELTNNLNVTPVYLAYLCLHIVKVLSSSKRYSEEFNMLSKFKKRFVNFKDLYFMECLAYIECGRYSKAKESLIHYVACPKGNYEYPCSKFENYYNIQQLLDDLNKSSINHKENILNVLIMAYENHPKLLDTIKNVSEIADNIIVVTKNDSNLDKQHLKNIGIHLVEVNGNNNGKHFLKGFAQCSGDFTLLMKPGELITLDAQDDLIELVSNTSENYFNISVLDTQLNRQSSEFRLFKNLKELKKYKTFKEFADYIYSNEILNVFISIYK